MRLSGHVSEVTVLAKRCVAAYYMLSKHLRVLKRCAGLFTVAFWLVPIFAYKKLERKLGGVRLSVVGWETG